MTKTIMHIAEAPGGVERYLVTLLTKLKNIRNLNIFLFAQLHLIKISSRELLRKSLLLILCITQSHFHLIQKLFYRYEK